MDLTPVIIKFFSTFIYLVPFIVLVTLIKTPWFKGIFGEFIVNILAKIFLNRNDYHLIKNVTLPTEDGTTQIDHVIVSKYGLFVVETKNMKGWIFGSAGQKTWTQKIYRHTNKFQNPLFQNYKHLKTMSSMLELSDRQVFSLVVFVGDSSFKTKMPENVTYGMGYIRFIKSKREIILSSAEIEKIISRIKSGRLTPSLKTNTEHVKHINDIVNEKKNGHTCPKCGSPMVLREVKKGQNAGKQFWGCSRFPKCRGTLNVI